MIVLSWAARQAAASLSIHSSSQTQLTSMRECPGTRYFSSSKRFEWKRWNCWCWDWLWWQERARILRRIDTSDCGDRAAAGPNPPTWSSQGCQTRTLNISSLSVPFVSIVFDTQGGWEQQQAGMDQWYQAHITKCCTDLKILNFFGSDRIQSGPIYHWVWSCWIQLGPIFHWIWSGLIVNERILLDSIGSDIRPNQIK